MTLRLNRSLQRLGGRARCSFLKATWLAAISLAAAGCSGPARPVMDPAQFKAYAAKDTEEMGAAMRQSVGKMIDRVKSRTVTSRGTEQATVNILALSGGGDYGAFGSGFLVGWGRVKDSQWQLPDFDAVTGVSTGAMIAPFAYIGTPEARETV